jgi:hypothetical protein
MVARNKAVADESLRSIEIGIVIAGREVIDKLVIDGLGASVKVKCVKCGEEATFRVSEFKAGHACPCYRRRIEDYKVGQIVGNSQIIKICLDVGNKHAITKCHDCGKETKCNAVRLNSERHCSCSKARGMKEHAAKKREYSLTSVVIGEIVSGRKAVGFSDCPNGGTAVDVECLHCGKSRSIPVAEYRLGYPCQCQVDHIRSEGEKSLEAFVRSLGLTPTHAKIGGKEVDILLEDLNIGIEYNGLHWHSEFRGKDNNYHLNKKTLAAKNGIDLIQIWEDQWLTRESQVKNYLRSRLGKNTKKVGVRVCNVVEIGKETAKDFINTHHIQEAKFIETAYGAYLDGELIAVASFARHHRNGSEIVLNRLCSKDYFTCTGFLGKVMKLAKAKYNVPIKSWVDRCLSEGGSYIKAGFALHETLPPDYFYHKRGKRVPKQSFRKVDDRAEYQRAVDEGLERVWDCGKHCFVYN